MNVHCAFVQYANDLQEMRVSWNGELSSVVRKRAYRWKQQSPVLLASRSCWWACIYRPNNECFRPFYKVAVKIIQRIVYRAVRRRNKHSERTQHKLICRRKIADLQATVGRPLVSLIAYSLNDTGTYSLGPIYYCWKIVLKVHKSSIQLTSWQMRNSMRKLITCLTVTFQLHETNKHCHGWRFAEILYW